MVHFFLHIHLLTDDSYMAEASYEFHIYCAAVSSLHEYF